MTDFADAFWLSADGLRLHYRDYPGNAERPPIICFPGLTRNARDFEPVVQHYAGDWRILCVDLRGRGESAYAKDWATYNPAIYVEDVEALLEQAEISQFVAIGTSLGGILTMLLAERGSDRIAAAVLNDIGPVIEAEGLDRVREYVGQGRTFPTWMHAARALRETLGQAHPDFGVSEWLRTAKRMMTIGGSGRIVFDYDMKIAEPFNRPDGAGGTDLWPCFEALTGRPVLAIRGATSDILSAETLLKMERRMPTLHTVTVARTGHAPTLDEPEALQAIDRLLAGLA